MSTSEKTADKASLFGLEVHMYVFTVLIKENDMPAERKRHNFVEIQHGSETMYKKFTERIKIIKIVIDNLLSLNFKLVVSLEHIDIMRKLQRLHILGRSAVLLINFLYYIFCHHNCSMMLP